MSTEVIFLFGLAITVMVLVAIIIINIGLMEAADPAHSRPEDLTSWEREAVRHKRDDLG
ncbi:MAG: hypothetical protein ACKVS9_17445 [Phycisphaerae bacterium]